MIEVICSYCKRVMGTKDGEGQEGESHGCCEECFEKIMKDLDEREAEFRGKESER